MRNRGGLFLHTEEHKSQIALSGDLQPHAALKILLIHCCIKFSGAANLIVTDGNHNIAVMSNRCAKTGYSFQMPDCNQLQTLIGSWTHTDQHWIRSQVGSHARTQVMVSRA